MYTLNRVKGKKNTTSPERGSGIKFQSFNLYMEMKIFPPD